MTYSDTQPRGTLRYRLLASSSQLEGSPLADPGTYVRHLAAELGDKYTFRETEVDDAPTPEAGIDDLRSLARECAVFLIGHRRDRTIGGRRYVQPRFCVNLLPPPDDISFLRTAHKIYVQHRKFPEALALAIRLGDPALVREDFQRTRKPVRFCAIPSSGHRLMKRQLAFLLARAQIPIEWLRTPSANPDEEIDIEDEFPEDFGEHSFRNEQTQSSRSEHVASAEMEALRSCVNLLPTRHLLSTNSE
ncbi:hypothetical protein R3P38DRAFT_2804253 [Favolaschia claudopus]|uniref:RPN1 N-terminal domain-containing protein n=1 Tax=Favolaschia claudopus TaxID=2862362 RepID=A0AAV9ZQL8_9AGAR